MTYRIPLPTNPEREFLDLVEPYSTSMQRVLRHRGLADYERTTQAAVLAVAQASRTRGDRTCMLDGGANIGLYSAMVAAIFPGSTVHAFEPTPSTAGMASRIMRASSVVNCSLMT